MVFAAFYSMAQFKSFARCVGHFVLRSKRFRIILFVKGLLFWTLYQYAFNEEQLDEESLRSYRPPSQAGVNQVGRRMEMDPEHWKRMFDGHSVMFSRRLLIDRMTDRVAGDFAFVTAASRDFYRGALVAIHTVQDLFPGRKIFFYDLEKSPQPPSDSVLRDRMSILCGVNYRQFDFTLYPEHVGELGLYAWKPIIIYEMLKEFSGVLWIDSSIRFVSNNLSVVLSNAVLSGGAVALTSAGHSNFAVTHPQMYAYLPTSMDGMIRSVQHEANCVLLYRTRFVVTNIVWWWVLCALDRNCIAPTKNAFCQNPYKSPKEFANCHRFDQSALNILLANQFAYDHSRYYGGANVAEVHRMYEIHEDYKVMTCPPGKPPIQVSGLAHLMNV